MIKTARGVHQAGMRFAIKTGSGHLVVTDDAAGDSGPRPAELLLVAQGGCTAMDVASILAKKRQAFDTYEISVEGTQRDDPHPHVFERMDLVHELTGDDLDASALSRAIELSATRYCTAAAMFSAGPAELHHRYVIHRRDGRGDETGEVVVTGPREDVGALDEQRVAAIGALAGVAR
jgi:putative redox protein